MSTKTKKKEKKKVDEVVKFESQLIVFNDDFNTFDFVISCFMEICKLTFTEAEIATLSIHVNGSEIVKTGEYEELKAMKDRLVECKIIAIVQSGGLN